jgi:multicomponent Na+:H+ antiporter subunit C
VGLSISLVIGILFAAGFYMMMSGSLLKVVLGLSITAQAANVAVFFSGGLSRGQAPLLDQSGEGIVAEPLSQAMVLTAIVIGFATTAFTVVLARQTYISAQTDETDSLRAEEM